MLVLDKPVGIAVHRGPDNAQARQSGQQGVALENYFDQLRFGLPRAPALAHRLDRDTSGCLVLGRHRKALERLGDLFKRGEIDKTYWAVVEGGPEADEGVVDLPLGRRDASRGWWMRVDPDGLPSRTLWRVLGRGVDPDTGRAIAWLALTPVTGRTHQLRVHCQSQGWPIVGDPIYGDHEGDARPRGGPPLHLHAREVDRAALQEQAADHRDCPRPRPHAPAHRRLRRGGLTGSSSRGA